MALSVGLLLSSGAWAQDAKQAFQQAYADYQAMLDVSETPSTELSAAAFEAYQTGRNYFGDDSINSANLAINYLKSPHSAGQDRDILKSMGDLILSVYEAELSKTDARWLDAYDAAMSIPYSSYRKQELRERYLALIAPLQKANPQLYAATLVDGAKYWHREDIPLAPILEPALEQLESELPASDLSVLTLQLYLAHNHFSKNRRNSAIELYESVIASANADEAAGRRLKLLSHAALVELYERKGESEQATEHCVAIGAAQPWSENNEPEPLFRVNPVYPISYATKKLSGSVTVQFDIDESGFVMNAEPIHSEDTPPEFVRSSIEAVESWRYAPKFENGEAVVATDQTVQLDFSIQ
ncbi:hypothetical protein CWE22_07975 [Pseudidiomarina aestuarii]|uniref:TonB C-terminal domain-containing protein n=1 Tax=Pseudidiomarina aestuarii TaxID=624146 RepID=A0A7Z6ZVF7_9GAMM|nr:energy transducer TonB [Pseudidiomarina aestuarii]RUO42071.1 hypothetical protein CWE22_07975 [Pseudidiomarina aestuarii]